MLLMKSFKKNTVFISILLMLIQCTNRSNPDLNFHANKNGRTFQIDFEKCLLESKKIMLSEIADSIAYLQLKTPNGVIISSIRNIIITGKHIFLISGGNAYQFYRDGRFIRQIGRKGKGPGEYMSAKDISIDPNTEEIRIFDSNKILYYSKDGKFIYSQNTNFNTAIAINDSIIWTELHPLGIFKNLGVAFNRKLDTLSIIPNYDIFSNKNGNKLVGVLSKYQKSLYQYKNNLYFKGFEDNDTIWELKLPHSEIHAIINMGKYKLPLDCRADYSYENFKKNARNYYSIPRIFEDDRYCFMIAQPRESKDLTYIPIIFDKENEIGYTVKNDTIFGITDDILNGPSFWPFFISDEYYIGVIEAYELIGKLSATNNNSLKYLLNNINENSNQLLIICKKKSCEQK